LSRQNLPDPSGEKNIGNGAGIQFIGGQCLSEADCASGCCATLPRGGETIGVCSGVGAQTQAGKQGCGFGGAGGGGGGNNNQNEGNVGNDNNDNNNDNNNGGGGGGNANNGTADANNGTENVGNGGGGAVPVIETSLVPDPNGAGEVGNGQGRSFITAECLSDADCASGCCATVNNGQAIFGICSGLAVSTANGKQGCGFVARR